jgi:two-component system chemotaxis sensor kinase CheA
MTKIIAWIEDDANIIWPVIRPLEQRHYDIVVMESMREALDRIEELRQCDLILLDVILPAQDERWEKENHIGVHLLETLREQDVMTPVLAFTVVGDPEVGKRLRELGVMDILHKPVGLSQLEEAVVTILGEEE